ncbi:MAG: hypothetical protein PHE12_02360 [Clostridia bacterium]|nr:hypothetical protein [Clostridia bacterium]
MLRRFLSKFKLKRQRQIIRSDNLGSYTGCPEDPYEKPQQDADDL